MKLDEVLRVFRRWPGTWGFETRRRRMTNSAPTILVEFSPRIRKGFKFLVEALQRGGVSMAEGKIDVRLRPKSTLETCVTTDNLRSALDLLEAMFPHRDSVHIVVGERMKGERYPLTLYVTPDLYGQKDGAPLCRIVIAPVVSPSGSVEDDLGGWE